MAYGSLMRQAWQLVWNNKFLIVIGAVPQALALLSIFLGGASGGLASIFIFAVTLVVQASLITGTLQLLDGGPSSYQLAWDAAWAKKWRIAGIELLVAVPSSIIGGVLGGVMAFAWVGFIFLAGVRDDPSGAFITFLTIEGILFALLILVSILIGIPASILGRGAVISCIIDDTPVFDSLQRAWNVLRADPGPAVILALLQLGINMGLGLVLLIPQAALYICPITWPVALGISGLLIAWWTAVWAIAWRSWLSPATN